MSIGEGTLIEDGVVLGHPAAAAVANVSASTAKYETVDDFYSSIVSTPTIIGANAIIRSGTVIYEGVTVGENFDCGHNVIIREYSTIGTSVYIKNNTEVMSRVSIGNGCRVAGVVADNTVLGERVSSFGVLTHAYRSYIPQRRAGVAPGDPSVAAPVVLDGVVIGRGAVVAGHVQVGEGATIGANVVVTRHVADGARISVAPHHITAALPSQGADD